MHHLRLVKRDGASSRQAFAFILKMPTNARWTCSTWSSFTHLARLSCPGRWKRLALLCDKSKWLSLMRYSALFNTLSSASAGGVRAIRRSGVLRAYGELLAAAHDLHREGFQAAATGSTHDCKWSNLSNHSSVYSNQVFVVLNSSVFFVMTKHRKVCRWPGRPSSTTRSTWSGWRGYKITSSPKLTVCEIEHLRFDSNPFIFF